MFNIRKTLGCLNKWLLIILKKAAGKLFLEQINTDQLFEEGRLLQRFPCIVLRKQLRDTLQSSCLPSLVCVYSEYLEVHQTELDKLTAQLKDMRRNSRLVRVILVIVQRSTVPIQRYWNRHGLGVGNRACECVIFVPSSSRLGFDFYSLINIIVSQCSGTVVFQNKLQFHLLCCRESCTT